MGVFNKTIIPHALVGYEMIIAKSALRALLATTISYPKRRIIVKRVSMRKPGRTRQGVIMLKSPISLKLGTKVSGVNLCDRMSGPNIKFPGRSGLPL